MAIENVESDLIGAMGTAPVPVYRSGGRMRYASAVVTTTGTTATAGSTYRAVRLPSAARIVFGTVYGIGAVNLPDVDVGAVHADDATVVDDDSLAVGLVIDDAGPHDFAGADGAFDPTAPAWSYTNATEDPGGEVDILLSLDVDAMAAGQARVVVHYLVD